LASPDERTQRQAVHTDGRMVTFQSKRKEG
jgi:hypothetical protein